jgi:hypothetical protein
MMNRQQLALLLLAAALGSATLPARSAPQEQVSPPTSSAPEKSAAPQQTPLRTPPAAPEQAEKSTAPDKKDKDSPFDYHSSEEISEDLPVSFPVDI